MKRCRFHFDISVQVSFRYQRLDLWRSRRWYRNEHCHFRKMNYPYFGRNGIWDTILTLDLILRNLFRERLVPGQLADGNTKIYIRFTFELHFYIRGLVQRDNFRFDISVSGNFRFDISVIGKFGNPYYLLYVVMVQLE